MELKLNTSALSNILKRSAKSLYDAVISHNLKDWYSIVRYIDILKYQLICGSKELLNDKKPNDILQQLQQILYINQEKNE